MRHTRRVLPPGVSWYRPTRSRLKKRRLTRPAVLPLAVALVASLSQAPASLASADQPPAAQRAGYPTQLADRPMQPRDPQRGACWPAGLSLAVPWAVGGTRILPNGSVRYFPGDWPDMPVQGIRLWDTRTAWLNIEPADDDWHFAQLDALVAKADARGAARITLVLAGTPRWAATKATPGEAHWLGPGSASPPRDIRQWRDFVRKVATRYVGRIDAYEIWNEPETPTFFSGTPDQWAQLVKAAAEEIMRVDRAASILASGFIMTTQGNLNRSLPWLRALAASGAHVDGLSLHWYPTSWRQIRGLGVIAQRMRRIAVGLGLPGGLWVTEANAVLRRGFPGRLQGQVVRGIFEQAKRAQLHDLTWYAWLDLPSHLMPIHAGTAAAMALQRVTSCVRQPVSRRE